MNLLEKLARASVYILTGIPLLVLMLGERACLLVEDLMDAWERKRRNYPDKGRETPRSRRIEQ